MNKLFTTTVVAALALIPSVVAARDTTAHRFTKAGETYVYTSTTQNERQVIDGFSETSGARFHLVVRDGIVSGVSGGQPVSFRVASAVGPRSVETAAR